MSDNRIISDSEYVVTSVAKSTADNRITKRPYTKRPVSDSKKKNDSDSDSFDDNLHSATPHNSSNDNSTTFSNELENKLRLQSEENARLAQAKFNQNTLNNPNPNFNFNKSIAEIELHNKLSQAMQVEVDTSTLSKKIELLNSLRNESNN